MQRRERLAVFNDGCMSVATLSEGVFRVETLVDEASPRNPEMQAQDSHWAFMKNAAFRCFGSRMDICGCQMLPV